MPLHLIFTVTDDGDETVSLCPAGEDEDGGGLRLTAEKAPAKFKTAGVRSARTWGPETSTGAQNGNLLHSCGRFRASVGHFQLNQQLFSNF